MNQLRVCPGNSVSSRAVFLMRSLFSIVLVTSCLGIPSTLVAQVTPEHRQALSEISKSLTRIPQHIRKKELSEAEAILDAAVKGVDDIAAAANVPKTDRVLAGVLLAIEKQQLALNKAQGKPSQTDVSFAGEIAPLIESRCLTCHGADNPRNGLRLDVFAGWKRGGRSGQLLVPGNASRSLLLARLAAPQDKGGMPQRGDMLTREEQELIARWINSGARFDGSSDRKSLGEIILEYEMKNSTVQIPLPKGTETVSFTRDIAPWFQNMCVRCHNSQRKSGGLSLASFYDMMKGGDSGEVIHPGDAENSRLFRLTGGKELPRMPNDNQVRITRQNYDDLVKWFAEGNTFDGADPRALLTSYVKSPEDLEAEKFARMTEPEFRQYRLDRSQAQFKRALPNDMQTQLESEHFLLLGSVAPARLEQVQQWAQEHLQDLQQTFGTTDDLWKGRLAIFVMKDRFGYDEFNLVVEQREADRDMTGHSRVTPTQDDAYIALQDIGDEITETSAGLRVNLIEHLTGAFLRRSGGSLPEWVVRGTGLALAHKAAPGSPYFRALEKSAKEAILGLPSPSALFQDDSYSPASLGPVGYTLVDYLQDASGIAKFRQFLSALKGGQAMQESLQTVYGASPAAIAQGYQQKLGRR